MWNKKSYAIRTTETIKKKMKYIPVGNTGQNRGRSPTCGVANLGFPKLSLVLFY